ncbi:MAG: type II secretion system F family protein [Candidatus Methylacidiphilales bacterium]
MIYVAYLCLIGVFVCIALAVRALGTQKKSSLADRLKAVSSGPEEGSVGLRDQEEMKKGVLERTILPMASKYSRHFTGITPARMVSSADQALGEAGMQTKITAIQLVTVSWCLMVLLPLFLGVMFLPHLAQGSIALWMYIGILFFACFLGLRLPIGIVGGKAKKRKHEIQLSLPFSFDLISIAVSAGMSFDGAMAMVSERTKGALSDEFRRTLREVNLGIPRETALNNLAARTGVDDLRTFITAINYISKLGGNLTEVIAIQTEALRVKRQQKAEEKANQAPVKIMIPLVLFILPCVFIVILGPAVVGLIVNPQGSF